MLEAQCQMEFAGSSMLRMPLQASIQSAVVS